MAQKHTLDSAKFAIKTSILERKVKPDGTVREYGCSLLHLDASLAIIEFAMGEGIPGLPVEIPAGSVSHGYFWSRRPYNLYRMRRPGGELIAHRFDAVTAVRLSAAAIDYRDLVLDWWALPDGSFLEEDRDEYDELRAQGLMSAADVVTADRAATLVSGRYRRIIAEAAQLERAHGIGLTL